MRHLKFFIYTFCVITTMLTSCNSNKSKPSDTTVITSEISDKESDEQKNKMKLLAIIHPALFDELDKFTLNLDVHSENAGFNINIIYVFFGQKKEGCCAFISTNHFYDSKNISGYIILNEKMVAFYNLEDECNYNLVNATKLITDKTDKYPDENSRPKINYDPVGKIFKINKEGKKLELIYSGNL